MLNYKDILNMITTPFLVADTEKTVLFANDQCIELLNLDRSKIHTIKLDELFKMKPTQMSKIDETLVTKKDYFYSTQFEHNNKEISEFQLTIKGVRIPMKNRLGYFIEIDSPKGLDFSDEDIIQLGKKTSDIAHEISNPLSVLKIQCDNFSLRAKKQDSFTSLDVLNRVKSLSHATDRIQQTTSELKTLSKSLMDLDADTIKTFTSNDNTTLPQH